MLHPIVGTKLQEREAMEPQTSDVWSRPSVFTFDSYSPFEFNIDLFNWLRKSIPLLDVAVIKKIQLIGKYQLDGHGNSSVQKILDNLHKKVKVNYFETGVPEFIRQIVDAAFETGNGYGEMIPYKDLNGIYKLKVARSKDIRYKVQDGEILLGQLDPVGGFQTIKFENQDLLFSLSFDRRQGSPQGYSLFHSLPFVGQIWTRILKTVENQVWRMGDPTFLFIIEGAGKTKQEYDLSKKYIGDIQTRVSKAYTKRRQGQVSDVFGATPTGSKLIVKTLGSDIQIMPLEIPMKLILEQIITKTGFPPFFFGIHWAATYNITKHQSDMIINSIKDHRETLDPIIEKIYGTELAMQGYAGAKWSWEWEDVNLMDLVEQARARQLTSIAVEKEINNLITLVGMGWETMEGALETLLANGIITNKMIKKYGVEETWRRIEQKYQYQLASKIYKEIA